MDIDIAMFSQILINSPLAFSVLTVVGMLVQILLTIRPVSKKDIIIIILTTCLSTVVGSIPDEHEVVYNLEKHLFVGSMFFVFSIALLFRDRILPKVYEGSVLILSCIFIYAMVTSFGIDDQKTQYAICIATLIAVLLVLPILLPFPLKLVVYAWFMFMIVGIAVLQFCFNDLNVFFGQAIQHGSMVAALVDGMWFMYIGTHITYLFILIPIPGKSQSISSRMDEWREDAAAMVAKFSDNQVNPMLGIIIVGGMGGVLYGNTITGVVDPWLLVSLLLLSTPLIMGSALAVAQRVVSMGQAIRKTKR